MPWAAARSSMARIWRTLATTCRHLSAAHMPIETWSSLSAEVGIESTLAGIAISIGVLVDGAIVEVENAYRKLEMWIEGGRVGEIAVRMGQEHCPGGFRLLSNFGHDAMQSQEHAHVHVIGGMFLGEYA